MTIKTYIFTEQKPKKPKRDHISLPIQLCTDEWLQHAQEVNGRIMKKYATKHVMKREW